MGSWLGIGVAFFGLIALGQVIMLIIVASRLVKMPMWAPLVLPITRDAVEDALPVLDTARAELERNGFRYIHTRRVRSLISIPGMPTSYCDVYHHGENDIHAEVYLASLPTPHKVCDVYLWNTFVEDTALLTVNNLAHSLIPYPRSVTVADGHAPDLTGHMATHLKARAAFAVARTEAADALVVAQKMAEQLLPRMQQEKLVYRRGERHGQTVYGFGFLAAVKSAWRMRRAALQLKKKANPAAGASPAPLPDFGAALPVAERLGFVRTLCMLRGLRAPRWFKRVVFFNSAVAFLAVGSWWWGLAGALVVAAVILVHEAGHWAAMKLAHFRDVQVFFVPGLGGATSGEKHEAQPMIHLMVYLAGPVPGLLLALGAFAWVAMGSDHSAAPWYPLLMTAAVATFFINALNMLPVLPLDGGRVVELLLVGRLPWLRFVFAVVSAGLLLVVGVSSGDNVFAAIGIAMLLGVQQHYRVAKASAVLLHMQTPSPANSEGFSFTAKQLFDFLAQPPFERWNYDTRVTVGQALLPRFLGRVPSWKEASVGMTVYLLSALVPLVGLAGLAVVAPAAVVGAIGHGLGGAQRAVDAPQPTAQAEATAQSVASDVDMQRKDRQAQRAATLAATQGRAQRHLAFQQAINEAQEDGDQEGGRQLAQQFYGETRTLEPLEPARVQAAMALVTALYGSDAFASKSEIAGLQLEAEGILRQRLAVKSDPQELYLLAQILEQRTPNTDKAAMLAMRQEVVAMFVAGLEPSDQQLAFARRNLARSLDRTGQAVAAEQMLRLAASDAAHASKSPTDQQAIADDLAWMLVAHRKLDEAAQLAQSQVTTAKPGDAHAWAPGQRNAHLVLLMVARLKGDWEGVRQQATLLRDQTASNTPQMGNWFMDLVFTRLTPPMVDRRATLLLIDSQRQLGQTAAADQLLAEFKKSARAFEKTPPLKNVCRMYVTDTLWRRELQQALLDIEQRELQCAVADQTMPDPAQFD